MSKKNGVHPIARNTLKLTIQYTTTYINYYDKYRGTTERPSQPEKLLSRRTYYPGITPKCQRNEEKRKTAAKETIGS
jgi:hypothetical protein